MTAPAPLPEIPAVYAPAVTAGPSRFQARVRLAAAIVLAVVFIGMWVFAFRFPDGASVEYIFFFMMTGSILGAVVIFSVMARLAWTRPARTVGIGRQTFAGLLLTASPLGLWPFLGVSPALWEVSSRFHLTYRVETAILAIFSAPIVLGIVFAVMAFRRGRTRSTVSFVVSLASGAVLIAAMVVPTELYGLRLAD